MIEPGSRWCYGTTRKDDRVAGVLGATSGSWSSIRSGSATRCSGPLEVDHPKRHAYGSKDLIALSTLADQMATAIHIAELRRPLVLTVGQIGEQVTALARVADSLRASASALAEASQGMRQGAGSWRGSLLAGSGPPVRSANASQAMVESGRAGRRGQRDRGRGGGAQPGGDRRGDRPAGRAEGLRRREAPTRWLPWAR